MHYVELVAILAIIQYLFFIVMTGLARAKSGLKAPAVVGDAGFERMYRVQLNTLEILMVLLPSLFIASKYWPSNLIAGLGVVYLIGRFIYWKTYTANPEKRGIGFLLSMLPSLLLTILSLIGVIRAVI